MTFRILITALAATLAPAGTALAALPQQSATADLAAPGSNPLVYGTGSGEQAGTSVAALGDVNGDGVDDMAVGAPLADANGRTDSGSVYVVYGRDGLVTRTDLARMGAAGVRIDGAAAGDRMGGSVARAGDVNGDGRDDLIAGASMADPSGRSNAGAAFVITGAANGTRIDAAALGTAGYRIDGAVAGDRAGSRVAGGGDVNGDGRDDVVLVAPQADPAGRTNAGSAWVVRDRPSGANVDLTAIGSNGFRIDAGAASDALASAAITPDATGDGRADVLVGAPGADPSARTGAGSAWLLENASGNVNLSAPGAGARIDGAAAGDALGAGVATSPDVTGDGIPELLLGATGADPNGRSSAGSLYLLRGRGLPASTDLATTAPVARVDGAEAGNLVGLAASGGGDLNGDGRDDLAVGDSLVDAVRTDAGAAYVLYGGALDGTIDLATPPAAATRVGGASAFENAGTSVAWLGDVNGDGRDDLLTGAARADTGRSNGGAAYVLLGFGEPSFGYTSTIEGTARLASGSAEPTGVRRTGKVTYSVSPALPPGMALDPATGVISGVPSVLVDPPVTHTVTMTDLAGSATAGVTVRIAPAAGTCANERPALGAGADVFTGSAGGDLILAGAGADTIDGHLGDDCLWGGEGDDALIGAAGHDDLHGGSEHDSLHGGGDDDNVSGDGGDDTITGDVGSDTLRGDGDQDDVRGGDGNDTVAGDEGGDAVAGDGGDDRVSGGSENDVLDGGSGRDVITADAGDDRAGGGDDADEVSGGDGNDVLYGGAGDDSVMGGLGNDFVDGGPGVDRLLAGPGGDNVHGGDGADLLTGDEDDDDLFGDAGDDELRGGASQDTLSGGEGADAITGEDGDDQVAGDAGNDLLSGGAGNDRLTGGAGDDVVAGGDGKDTIEETAGRDRISAGAGNDGVTLRRGGASVDAGAGIDKVVAYNGKRDTINCGSGRDTAYVDKGDRVKGCEKRIYSKPGAASKKRRKKKKSSRAGR